jgi:hypothetical protein
MRRLLALAAVTGLTCLAQGASAAPVTVPTNPLAHEADWGYGHSYCGPECQRHRYWAHRRWERERHYGYASRYSRPYYYRGY